MTLCAVKHTKKGMQSYQNIFALCAPRLSSQILSPFVVLNTRINVPCKQSLLLNANGQWTNKVYKAQISPDMILKNKMTQDQTGTYKDTGTPSIILFT